MHASRLGTVPGVGLPAFFTTTSHWGQNLGQQGAAAVATDNNEDSAARQSAALEASGWRSPRTDIKPSGVASAQPAPTCVEKLRSGDRDLYEVRNPIPALPVE